MIDQRSIFAAIVRDLRRRHGMSLRAAARAMGFTPPSLHDIEQARRNPGKAMLDALARVYHVDRSGLYALCGRIPDDELPETLEDAVFAMAAFRDQLRRDRP